MTQKETESEKPRFASPGDALKVLSSDYNAWSELLTRRSVEISFALIGANWAVHGTADKILENDASKWSLILIMSFLGLNLLATKWMAWLLVRRFRYGEKNAERWKCEYNKTKGKVDPWPYTRAIERLASSLQNLKIWAPILSAVLFIASLFITGSGD